MHDLKTSPAAHHQYRVVEGQSILGQLFPNHLVHGIVPSHVLVESDQVPESIKETCCMQATGLLKYLLCGLESFCRQFSSGTAPEPYFGNPETGSSKPPILHDG